MSLKCRHILNNPWYQRIFPRTKLDPSQGQKHNFHTTERGQYYSSAILSATGEGGDFVMCFPYGEVVHTEFGLMEIGRIVEDRLNIRVWSYNKDTKRRELKPVVGWYRNGPSELVKVNLDDGRNIVCTPNHKILTSGRGMVEAVNLRHSDVLPREPVLYRIYRPFADFVSRCNGLVSVCAMEYLKRLSLCDFGYFAVNPVAPMISAFTAPSYTSPKSPRPDIIDAGSSHAIPLSKDGSFFLAFINQARLFFGKFGARPVLVKGECPKRLGVIDVLASCAISKIAQRIVGADAIKMANVVPKRSRPDKRKHNRIMACNRYALAVLSSIKLKIPVGVFLAFYNLRLVFVKRSTVPKRPFFGSYIAKIGNAIKTLKSRDGSPIKISHAGYAEKTYCLNVSDNHTFYTGGGQGIIVSNCDDPLNPVEAASDTMRKATMKAIRGTLFSRFNDPRTGRFILTMQRLHEADPTGELLKDGGYVHVKLPAEAPRPLLITLGKKKWTMEKGDLLFPARLSRETLDEKRLELGEYNYIGQYIQEPVPVGGGEFKDNWVQYYPNGGIKPTTMNICILCDASAGDANNKKKKKTSDFTAFVVVGLAPDNNYYVLDMIRDRFNPTERIDTLFMLHRKWNAASGKPPRVGYEEYGLMSDIHYIKLKNKEDAYNFQVIQLKGRVSKETRIRRMIPDMERGRWYFPENLIYIDSEARRWDLVHELIYSEMANFPMARYDDALDALTRVYDEEMSMNFPRPSKSEKQKLLGSSMGMEKEEDSWLNF